MQMQRHGLLGGRSPQPLDLLPRRRQLGGLGGQPWSARYRRGESVQRALLGRAADVHHCGAIHADLSAASRCVACWEDVDEDLTPDEVDEERAALSPVVVGVDVSALARGPPVVLRGDCPAGHTVGALHQSGPHGTA